LITTGRGVIGFVIPMLECVTPALVMFAEPIGISGSVGWLDYVLVPAMAICVALATYAIVLRRRRPPPPNSNWALPAWTMT
jgi:mercuric ion transport protein